MKKLTSLHITLIVIGSLSTISGIYLMWAGAHLNSYLSGMVTGISLIGGALIHAKEHPKQDQAY